MHVTSSDEEIIGLIERFRQKWGLHVTAGTIFGPTRVKVTSKPKEDFHVLPNHAGLFCRQPAVERLLREGVAIEFVETPATGKWGAEAGYVELVVPVMGHVQFPVERSFCAACSRYSPAESFPRVLQRGGLPTDRPFFKTVETGTIVFSSGFIELTRRLEISGFVEGKTLHPVRVAETASPRPTLAELQAEERRYDEEVWQRRWEEAASRKAKKKNRSC